MKTIIVTRHAKSSWDNILQKDVDRVLNTRGQHDAPLMGNKLQQRNISVDVLISSNAARAVQTAKLIAPQINYPLQQITYEPKLYHASADTITDHIVCIDDAINTAMIVCHNPGITNWANEQVGYLIDNMPTCGMIAFTISETSWANFITAPKQLLFIDFPKNGVV
jgi:phosphohistidine phosphatase